MNPEMDIQFAIQDMDYTIDDLYKAQELYRVFLSKSPGGALFCQVVMRVWDAGFGVAAKQTLHALKDTDFQKDNLIKQLEEICKIANPVYPEKLREQLK